MLDFTSLDLSGVTASKPFVTLSVGEHEVLVKDVEYKTEGARGTLMIEYEDQKGGSIREWLNIFNPSEKNQEISREKLKSLLTAGGHPTPDHPGDVKSIVGLRVRIYVGMSKPWTGRDGKVNEARPEVKSHMVSEDVREGEMDDVSRLSEMDKSSVPAFFS